MNCLPKKLFFAVWDLPELRSLIRSFMWPGRRSATWYKYRDLQAAVNNGYIQLYNCLSSSLPGYITVSTDKCVATGNLEMLKAIGARCDSVMQIMIAAIQHERSDIIEWLLDEYSSESLYLDQSVIIGIVSRSLPHIIKRVCGQLPVNSHIMKLSMDTAAEFGRLDIVEWLYSIGARGREPIYWAAKHGHVDCVRFFCERAMFAGINEAIVVAAHNGHEGAVVYLADKCSTRTLLRALDAAKRMNNRDVARQIALAL